VEDAVPAYPTRHTRFDHIRVTLSERPVLEMLEGLLRTGNNDTILRLQATGGGNSLNCVRNLLCKLRVYRRHFGGFERC